MKKIKILFDGFYEGADYGAREESRIIMELLQKHYVVELSDTPDYIFCNVDSAEYYKYDGVRIFCTIEAICPDFNLCDYGIGFEYLTYGDRYFRFPNFYFNPDTVCRMADKHKNIADDLADRRFCSFVYSNDKADSMREKLYDAISSYKEVDSGGRYRNNLPDKQPVKDKLAFEQEHKFSIACENACHPGYHTEKLAEAFAAKTVPVYWGDPSVEKVFNPKAFINCSKYSSMEEIIQRVEYLDRHPEEYLAMLREPALTEASGLDGKGFAEKKLKDLEDYLVHIFEPPLEEAYRRNRGFWGRQYLQTKRSEGRVIERYGKIRNMPVLRLARRMRDAL